MKKLLFGLAAISLIVLIGVLFNSKEEYTINEYNIEVIYVTDEGCFVDSKGEQTNSIIFRYKQNSTLIDPLKEGDYSVIGTNKKLVGWYLDDYTPWNFETDIVLENIILYAKWE